MAALYPSKTRKWTHRGVFINDGGGYTAALKHEHIAAKPILEDMRGGSWLDRLNTRPSLEYSPMHTARLMICLPLLVLLVGACTPQAQWPHGDASQLASPDNTNVSQAIAASVDWWTTREPTATSKGPVMVALTPSLHAASEGVGTLLPGCEMVDINQPGAVIIEGVRMHQGSAQVDLSAPRPERGRQLLTLNLRKFPLTDWEVRGANWWRFNDRQLDRITRQAHETTATEDDFADGETSDDDQQDATVDASDEP